MIDDIVYWVYVVGGLTQAVLAYSLVMYYMAQSSRIESKYFKALAYTFIGTMYFGMVWVVGGVLGLLQLRADYIQFIPFLTATGLIIFIITLFNFWLRTGKK